MLIVVAIIAILIAISIPLVNSALEKAKHATDSANERAAKAALVIEYLEGKAKASPASGSANVYLYDAKDGKIIDASESGATAPVGYGQHKDHTNKHYIAMTIDSDGVVTMQWTDQTTLSSITSVTDDGNKLCTKAKDVKHSTT